MRNMVNIKEIAEFCANRFRDSHESENRKYVDTMYVAIFEDDSIQFSYTPHILSEAHKAILIHRYSERAVTNWYWWYNVECIDSNGAVSGNLDERFSIGTVAYGSYSNQKLRLKMEDEELDNFSLPVDNHKRIHELWDLYLGARKCDTLAEARLLAKLNKAYSDNEALKDEIKELQYSEAFIKKQMREYETLLDEIKSLVHKGE